MTNLVPFQFEGNGLRVVMGADGEPWFVGADVCAVLENGNPRQVLSRLDDDERGVQIVDTPGGKQEMTIINESGLYSLILTSRKPAAKRFKKWVTAEVLPSIRKTGQYGLDLNDPAALRQALITYTEKFIALEHQVEVMQPKADFHDRVTASEDCHTLDEAAKVLRTGRNRLAAFLRSRRFLMTNNLPYQAHLDRGLFRVVETPYTDHFGKDRISTKTVITGKGMAIIQRLLDSTVMLPAESYPQLEESP